MRQASTLKGNETESLPKERVEKGVVVRLCTKSKRKLEGEPMYYRGIKQTPENTAKDKKKKSVAGIYRGIKHDAIKSDKSASKVKSQGGIYHGVKHG